MGIFHAAGMIDAEVKHLCKQYDMDYDTMKAWYNGYLIDGIHMYNPNSISLAMDRHRRLSRYAMKGIVSYG